MSVELQKIDCNCSDCTFMVRSLVNRQHHADYHYNEQKRLFNTKRIKLLKNGEKKLKKGENDKAKLLFKEARDMRFEFNGGYLSLHYGQCTKFNKDVSFVANTCQLDTQECFKHRSEA